MANSAELQFWLMKELPETIVERIEKAIVEVSPFTEAHKVRIQLKNGITLRFVWTGPRGVSEVLIPKIAMYADSENDKSRTVYL